MILGPIMPLFLGIMLVAVGSCTEVEDQGEIARDEDPDGMESGSP